MPKLILVIRIEVPTTVAYVTFALGTITVLSAMG